jgi:dTDP-4-dehydrorhamnose 3,5-epimerase
MGEVVDVILDIRIGSPTYMQTEAIKLSRDLGDMIFLPPGIAHGFFSVTDALMEYLVTSEYSPEHDSGIYWNSINFKWPNLEVITSPRDDRLLPLKEFNSPFIYQKK